MKDHFRTAPLYAYDVMMQFITQISEGVIFVMIYDNNFDVPDIIQRSHLTSESEVISPI